MKPISFGQITIACLAGALIVTFFAAVQKGQKIERLSKEVRAQEKAVEAERVEKLERKLSRYKQDEKRDKKVAKLTLMLMDLVNADLTPAKKQIVAQTVVRVTDNIFKTQGQRESFAVLLAIESKFKRTAKSSVGALGASQVMPEFSEEFASLCGIPEFNRKDLWDFELNITIGACQFRKLLDTFNGNTAAALVAYNAGMHSTSLKQLKGLENISNIESSSYVSKFLYLNEEAKNMAQNEKERRDNGK